MTKRERNSINRLKRVIELEGHKYALEINKDPTSGDYVYARTAFVKGANWLYGNIVNRNKPIHPIQEKLLLLMQAKDLNKMSLRAIGKLIQVDHPQRVKHHINQLNKAKSHER